MARLFLFAVCILVAQIHADNLAALPAEPTPVTPSVPLFSAHGTGPVALPAAFVGRVLLHANVNGALMWLHLDTGNATLLLGTDDARKANLVADPVTHNSQRVRVAIGDIIAPAVFFSVSRYGFEDSGHWVAGNIGTPFFRANIVTIDYPRRQVIFYPDHTYAPPANATPTPIFMHNNIPTIDVSFGSVRGRFDLDTGAEVTELSPSFARHIRLGLNVGEIGSYGCGHQEDNPEYITPDFIVGGITVKQLRAVVANPCGVSDDGVLGRDVLSHLALTLDYVNHIAYFSNPSP
jgi:Aspartyl protease